MNHYDGGNILDLCSQSHRLASALAKKVGMEQEEIEGAQQGLRLMADKVSKAICHRALYTVALVQCLADNSIKHENILTTPLAEEALQLRDDINQDAPIFGAKRIAQVVRREVMPRRWELWAQLSESEIHLRCQLTNARSLLKSAGPEVLARLYCGKALAQDHPVYLQSEKIAVTTNFISTRQVRFTRGGGRIVTHDVKVCNPVVADLDINDSSEMTVDTRRGVIARYPIEAGMVTVPGHFAKTFRLDGVALPLRLYGNGWMEVRLTSLELLSRLKLSCRKEKRRKVNHWSPHEMGPLNLLAA